MSMDSIETPWKVHESLKMHSTAVGMVINKKKRAIQLNIETPHPEYLRDIPRLDETTYKYLGFEMKNGEVDRKLMTEKIEQRI